MGHGHSGRGRVAARLVQRAVHAWPDVKAGHVVRRARCANDMMTTRADRTCSLPPPAQRLLIQGWSPTAWRQWTTHRWCTSRCCTAAAAAPVTAQHFSGLVALRDGPGNGQTCSVEAVKRCPGAIRTHPQVLGVRHNLQGCHGHLTCFRASLGSHAAKEAPQAGGCLCLPPCTH